MIMQGLSDRFDHAWFTPCTTAVSPARTKCCNALCLLMADFVVKVAEEEQRVWREARSLAYTQSGGWGLR
jgi:hypothetical protein